MELYVSTTKVWNIEFDDSDFIDFFECGYCREKNRNRKLFSLPSLDPRRNHICYVQVVRYPQLFF